MSFGGGLVASVFIYPTKGVSKLSFRHTVDELQVPLDEWLK